MQWKTDSLLWIGEINVGFYLMLHRCCITYFSVAALQRHDQDILRKNLFRLPFPEGYVPIMVEKHGSQSRKLSAHVFKYK